MFHHGKRSNHDIDLLDLGRMVIAVFSLALGIGLLIGIGVSVWVGL